MGKSVLFCATVDSHLYNFHLPFFKWFKDQGWEVHAATSGELNLPFVDKRFNIPIKRSPYNLNNIKAYIELKEIINENRYDIIHCHTPVGGVLSRLAARNSRKTGTKLLYTAHGFHFYQGAPLINWLSFYPIEKILANLTDCLITINKEDFQLIKNRRFKAKSIKHVHGVGVNNNFFQPSNEREKLEIRKEIKLNPSDFIMFYAAEFNKNKNQQFLIKSIARIKQEIPNAKLLLAGDGSLINNCRNLVEKLGLMKDVIFLGHRKGVIDFLKASDLVVASSIREGLPVNIMEAMSCGLPIIASDNRGHRELIHNNKNGFLVKINDEWNMSEKIKLLANDSLLRKRMGNRGREMIENNYSIDYVLGETSRIYESIIKEKVESIALSI